MIHDCQVLQTYFNSLTFESNFSRQRICIVHTYSFFTYFYKLYELSTQERLILFSSVRCTCLKKKQLWFACHYALVILLQISWFVSITITDTTSLYRFHSIGRLFTQIRAQYITLLGEIVMAISLLIILSKHDTPELTQSQRKYEQLKCQCYSHNGCSLSQVDHDAFRRVRVHWSGTLRVLHSFT